MEIYNWDTEFNTACDLMIHTFSKRVKVVVYRNKKQINVFKDGEINRTLACPLSEEDYRNFLVSVAKDAEKLEKFDMSPIK